MWLIKLEHRVCSDEGNTHTLCQQPLIKTNQVSQKVFVWLIWDNMLKRQFVSLLWSIQCVFPVPPPAVMKPFTNKPNWALQTSTGKRCFIHQRDNREKRCVLKSSCHVCSSGLPHETDVWLHSVVKRRSFQKSFQSHNVSHLISLIKSLFKPKYKKSFGFSFLNVTICCFLTVDEDYFGFCRFLHLLLSISKKFFYIKAVNFIIWGENRGECSVFYRWLFFM